MIYEIQFSKQGKKDYMLATKSQYSKKLKEVLQAISINPQNADSEALTGDMLGLYSMRINRQHRVVYDIDETKKLVTIFRTWTHYER